MTKLGQDPPRRFGWGEDCQILSDDMLEPHIERNLLLGRERKRGYCNQPNRSWRIRAMRCQNFLISLVSRNATALIAQARESPQTPTVVRVRRSGLGHCTWPLQLSCAVLAPIL